MNIFEITDNYKKLETKLEYLLSISDEDLEVAGCTKEQLDNKIKQVLELKGLNKDEFTNKVNSICWIIDNCRTRSRQLKEREAAMKKERDSVDKKEIRLTNTLSEILKLLNVDSVECDFKVGFRQQPQSVQILDSQKIPSEFLEVETKTKIKVQEISNALKSGIIVDGCQLVRADKKIQIK